MQAPGARPQAHRSCVSAGLWPTLERVFCVSPPPCRYSSVATTSASLLPSCSAHQPRPRVSHPPLTASRGALPACSVSRARPRACDRLMAAARAMRRCSPHFWVLSMRACGDAGGGVRRIRDGGRCGDRGRARSDCTYSVAPPLRKLGFLPCRSFLAPSGTAWAGFLSPLLPYPPKHYWSARHVTHELRDPRRARTHT